MGLLSAANLQRSLNQRFEKFVRDAFAHMYNIEDGDSFGCDLIFRSKTSSEAAVVEVNLHRSQWASLSTVRSAAAKLQAAQFNAKATHAILIVNTLPDPAVKAEAQTYGVLLYDVGVLWAVARLSTTLLLEFDSLQQEAIFFESPPTRPETDVPNFESETVDREIELEEVTAGDLLYAELAAIPHGDRGKDHEKTCERIVRYLFEDTLAAWQPQHESVEGLHRFDLIARVKAKHDFWTCIQQRFSSQYVVFEFKNYRKKITQAEVYTTEKYLFPKALRGTAIILSRLGPDEHASVASRGALRESGKLILHCSDEDLRQMLRLKDKGDDPSDLLLGALDMMLMSIER